MWYKSICVFLWDLIKCNSNHSCTPAFTKFFLQFCTKCWRRDHWILPINCSVASTIFGGQWTAITSANRSSCHSALVVKHLLLHLLKPDLPAVLSCQTPPPKSKWKSAFQVNYTLRSNTLWWGKQRACSWSRPWRQICRCLSWFTALNGSHLLLLLEQSTVRNFETASKSLLLAESSMSLGHPYMPMCAWIFKWWLCEFSPTAMLYKAPTIKISLLRTISVTLLWRNPLSWKAFSPMHEEGRCCRNYTARSVWLN